MKKLLVSLVILSITALIFCGCCKAGTGGNATLTVSVLSDSKNPIYNTIVYLKYGQSTPPASVTGFDAKLQPSGSNTVTFKNLKCGTYYLFASGYDSTLKVPVSGGAPLSILHKDRNKTTTTNMYISQ